MSGNRNQEVAVRSPPPAGAIAAGLDADQWRVLREAIFPAAKSEESILLALSYCKARGLDVFRRPVHIVPVYNSQLGRMVETVWEGINSIQVTAARTKEWAGIDTPKWGELIEETWTDADKKQVTVYFPEWCELTAYRMVGGQRCSFTEVVYWIETYASQGRNPAPNSMWQKRPRGQLLKCARAAVLRVAFPEAGDYAAEEMEGKTVEAGGIVIQGSSEVLRDPEPEHPPARTIDVFDEHGEALAAAGTLAEALKLHRAVMLSVADQLARALPAPAIADAG